MGADLYGRINPAACVVEVTRIKIHTQFSIFSRSPEDNIVRSLADVPVNMIFGHRCTPAGTDRGPGSCALIFAIPSGPIDGSICKITHSRRRGGKDARVSIQLAYCPGVFTSPSRKRSTRSTATLPGDECQTIIKIDL